MLGNLIANAEKHTPPLDVRIGTIAARQHGVVSVGQLRAAGLTSAGITRRLRRGSLHRLHAGVYAVVGPDALSREARWLAAVLAAGDGSVLSHESAAELHAIGRRRPSLIAVTTPTQRRPTGVRVHRYRTLDRRDVTTHRGIPVTTVHRTLIDLADALTPHQLTNVIHEAAFRGRFVEPAVRDAMERAPGRHNLAVLERAIALYRRGSAGTRSGNEDAFLALVAALGWPEPRVNADLLGHEVDFHWPELMLVVEIDGPGHERPPSRRDDALRDRAHRTAGYAVLRFTDADVRERPRDVTAVLAAVHGTWRPRIATRARMRGR